MLAKNESQIDRAIRLIVGLVLLVVGSQLGGWLQIILYILAIIALITAATGVCWLYKLFGWNTDKTTAKPVETPAGAPTEEPMTSADKPQESAEDELAVEEPTEENSVEEKSEQLTATEPETAPTGEPAEATTASATAIKNE